MGGQESPPRPHSVAPPWGWAPGSGKGEGGGSDRAPFGREMLQATCRRTLEVTRTALLFLSSSLGTERWVSCPGRGRSARGAGPSSLSVPPPDFPTVPPPVQSC